MSALEGNWEFPQWLILLLVTLALWVLGEVWEKWPRFWRPRRPWDEDEN